jgi:hypothetical protein
MPRYQLARHNGKQKKQKQWAQQRHNGATQIGGVQAPTHDLLSVLPFFLFF